jgi:serine/threonine protein kinase/tetratricopeptide (TPR) repeat protein
MPLAPGANLGPYHVLAAIGSGSMGEVYRARDHRLQRDVALKVLPASVALAPERLSRFVREAQLLASLNHPNIVTIHSVEEAEGVPFLTMELVEGQTLDRIVAAGRLGVSQLLEVASAIADALVVAHAKGIVHRDLKPANVMLSDDGRIKVVDFGLATELQPADSAESTPPPTERPRTGDNGPAVPSSTGSTVSMASRTRWGAAIGTPAYMSPEQVVGRGVDHRADLFAFGVILYELASGRRPFAGASPDELASAIQHDTPAAITDVRTDLPDGLVRLIGHCLEKAPQGRPQTAAEVRAALSTLTSRSSTDSASRLAIAVLPFSDLSATKDQGHLCEGMAEEIMNALFRVPGIRVASRTAAFRAHREGLEPAAIADALSVSHILDGSVRISGSVLRLTAQLTDVASGLQIWSERYDRDAADVFAVQDAIAAGVVEAVRARLVDGPRVVRTRRRAANITAYRAYLRGRHLRHTKNDFRGALASFEEAVRLDPSHAASWVGLADAVTIGGVYSAIPARVACAKAKAALATARALEGDSADSLQAEGGVAYLERRWSQWESAYRRAIDLQPDHPQALAQFGMTLCTRLRVDEAQTCFDRLRDADPLDVVPYAFAGAGLVAAGRSYDALLAFDDAFAIEPDHTLALWGAGMANVALGHVDEGIATVERGVAMTGRAAHFVGVLGWACVVAGRRDEAIALLDELRGRPPAAPTVVAEGWLLGALGETDAAFELLARAEEEQQALLYYIGLPAFDTLRADPRFAALLVRLDLPPGR